MIKVSSKYANSTDGSSFSLENLLTALKNGTVSIGGKIVKFEDNKVTLKQEEFELFAVSARE